MVTIPKCEVCAAEAECAVWGHPVCCRCASDYGNRAPTYGDIEAKHGQDVDAAEIYRAHVLRWIAARKARPT